MGITIGGEVDVINIYDRVQDIHYFLDYRADELNYGLQDQNILYCAHKLNDIYSVYCIARANLHYLDNENFGDFASNDIAIEFVRVQLIMNALHYYNILIDLSWQLIWFSIRTDLNNDILTTKTYNDVAKECNYEILRYNLTLLRDFKMRDKILNDFFKNKTVQDIREKWNFLKHRGTFYFKNLGMNPSKMNFSINGLKIPIVNRNEIIVDKLKETLIEFDIKYYNYITYIMDIIFPTDYLENSDFFNSPLNYFFKYKEQIADWNKTNQ